MPVKMNLYIHNFRGKDISHHALKAALQIVLQRYTCHN